MWKATVRSLLLACLIARIGAAAAEPTEPFPRVQPTAPDAAGATFRALDGFRMELIAAEPLVTDPVAMAYDENGLAYVVEMNDYPYTDKAAHRPWEDNTTDRPIGRVRVLEDADGDGRFDRATVFADGLSWPTGVACWKGGAFVTATPDVWYLKDTDGDRKADVRRRVFTGFRKYNVQAVINNPVWGLDNRLYVAGATNGGRIVPAGHPGADPVPLGRNDFRIDPVTERFEVLSGGARFGNAFDDWGNRFVCNIRNPVQHVVIEHRYLRRNPHLPVASALHDAAESGDALPVYRVSPPEPWRETRARRWAGDRTVAVPRSELIGAGVVTSASGITVYRGAAYPEAYRGQVFLGEVANNLVHRQRLSPAGATFSASRIDRDAEFVASADVWFRPVNFVNAPDGTLHVLDMYREVIEHPWSIPDDIHARLDLRSGSDRGRIYRLAPPGFKAPPPPRLGRASVAELVATLEHPDAWWRQTAQRSIVERRDLSAVPPLRRLLAASTRPLARLHALWALHGLDAAGDDDVLRALRDESPGVRENACRAAEGRLANSPRLLDQILRLAEDPAARVRFQAALTLGECDDPRVPEALTTIALRDAADPWARTAVLTSASPCSDVLLGRLLSDQRFANSDAGRQMLRQLAAVIGGRNEPAEVGRALEALTRQADRALRADVVLGLAQGLKRAGRGLRQAAAGSATPGAGVIADLLAQARADAADERLPLPARVRAVQLLGHDEFARANEVLAGLLAPRQPQEVQRAAVAALAGFDAPQVGTLLMSGWPSYSPAVRGDVVQAMLGRASRLAALLDAIEAGRVAPGHVPASRRTLLLRHADATIRSRATKLFGDAVGGGGRKEVIEQYRPALGLAGDAAGGRKVFEERCATCHRAGDLGHELGPNLATIRSWSAEQLLVNTLDPNREVAPEFVEYVVELVDGRTVSGVITAETAAGVTLAQPGGARETVLRRDVRRLSGSGLSVMPEGLESELTAQDLADLLTFLRSP